MECSKKHLNTIAPRLDEKGDVEAGPVRRSREASTITVGIQAEPFPDGGLRVSRA